MSWLHLKGILKTQPQSDTQINRHSTPLSKMGVRALFLGRSSYCAEVLLNGWENFHASCLCLSGGLDIYFGPQQHACVQVKVSKRKESEKVQTVTLRSQRCPFFESSPCLYCPQFVQTVHYNKHFLTGDFSCWILSADSYAYKLSKSSFWGSCSQRCLSCSAARQHSSVWPPSVPRQALK